MGDASYDKKHGLQDGVHQEHGSRGVWQGVEQVVVVKETQRGVVDIKENLKIGLILLKD